MLKKSILTRDALIHRGGKFEEDVFSDLPLFCGKDESIEHIFFACPLARYLWNIVSCVIGSSCHFKNVNECFTIWIKNSANQKRN
jgi:hypothetical protein